MLEKLPHGFAKRYRGSMGNWKKNGIKLYTADAICVTYGYHPYEIYGDAWYEDIWKKDMEASNG